MKRKIKLAWIENETSRKASFKKRKTGLVKKMQELTTLCDVSACLIIYAPGDSLPSVTWPNKAEAKHVIRRFWEIPEADRAKKMVNHEDYLESRAAKMTEQIQRMRRKNAEVAASEVMRQINRGRDPREFTAGDLARLAWFLEERMSEIDRRLGLFDHPVRRLKMTLPPPTEDEISGRRDFPLDFSFGQPPNYEAAPQNQPHVPGFVIGDGSGEDGLLGNTDNGNGNSFTGSEVNAGISAGNEGYDGIYSGLDEIGENLASGTVITGKRSYNGDKSDGEIGNSAL